MATGRQIKAGSAFVQFFLDDGPLQRGLKTTEARLRQTGAKIRNIGAGALAIGGALAAPFVAAIKSAGDFEETLNRFTTLFGENAKAARAFAEEYGKAVGRSQSQLLGAMSDFQGLASGLGLSGEQAAEFSKELTKLSTDFASFNNLADDDAINRFIQGLSGSSEVWKRYGIDTMQASLATKGITKESTELEKVMARLEIVRDVMGKQGAIGDAEKTAGSFTNQLKALRARLSDTAVTVGTALMPAIKPLVAETLRLVKIGADWIKNNQETVVMVAKVTAVVAIAGGALITLGTAMQAAAFATGGFSTAIALSSKVIGVLNAVSLAGMYKSLTVHIIPSMIAATTAANALKVGMIGLKVAMGGAVLYVIYRVSMAIYKANGNLKAFNESLKESARLSGKLASRQERLQQKTLQIADKLTGNDQVDYLKTQLERAEKELAGTKASVKGQEKVVGGLDTAFNNATGNKILEGERENLSDLRAKESSLQNFTDQLRDALDAAEKAKDTKPQNQTPAEEVKEAVAKAEEEAKGKAISEAQTAVAETSLTPSGDTLKLAADLGAMAAFGATGGLAGVMGSIATNDDLQNAIADLGETGEEARSAGIEAAANSAVDFRSSKGQEEIARALGLKSQSDKTVDAIKGLQKSVKEEGKKDRDLQKKSPSLKVSKT